MTWGLLFVAIMGIFILYLLVRLWTEKFNENIPMYSDVKKALEKKKGK